jgi:acetyl-CoA carboxylase biotin carboxyl carrier protein
MAQWDEQLEKIKQIIEIMTKEGLVEVEIKQGNDKISIKKGQAESAGDEKFQQLSESQKLRAAKVRDFLLSEQQKPQLNAENKEKGAPATTPQKEILAEIKSPLVGTFYARPSPDSEPYIEVGSHVDPETVVCIIEAMKVMNEIKAEVSGTIVEVVAVSGEAVEYGQVLFRVRPD